jgi:hypothetical protein
VAAKIQLLKVAALWYDCRRNHRSAHSEAELAQICMNAARNNHCRRELNFNLACVLPDRGLRVTDDRARTAVEVNLPTDVKHIFCLHPVEWFQSRAVNPA